MQYVLWPVGRQMETINILNNLVLSDIYFFLLYVICSWKSIALQQFLCYRIKKTCCTVIFFDCLLASFHGSSFTWEQRCLLCNRYSFFTIFKVFLKTIFGKCQKNLPEFSLSIPSISLASIEDLPIKHKKLERLTFYAKHNHTVGTINLIHKTLFSHQISDSQS